MFTEPSTRRVLMLNVHCVSGVSIFIITYLLPTFYLYFCKMYMYLIYNVCMIFKICFAKVIHKYFLQNIYVYAEK